MSASLFLLALALDLVSVTLAFVPLLVIMPLFVVMSFFVIVVRLE